MKIPASSNEDGDEYPTCYDYALKLQPSFHEPYFISAMNSNSFLHKGYTKRPVVKMLIRMGGHRKKFQGLHT